MNAPVSTWQHALCVLETALLTASEPLSVDVLLRLFGGEYGREQVLTLLQQLQDNWSERGAELVESGGGWRFRARPQFQVYLDRLHPEKPPRYSRAVMETLAIIAWKQPVTRGDIEAIRGVGVSTQVIRQLEERGWVEVIGHREVPGRPGLYATTRRFLQDFNLRTLADLPPLSEPGQVDDVMQRLKETQHE